MRRALFIGRSVLDAVALVEDFPGLDEKTIALANDVLPGGSALNAAVTFAYLGGDAALATSLGAPGLMREFITDDLLQHKVKVHDICDDPAYRVPISIVVSTRSVGARMIVNGADPECGRFRNCAKLLAGEYDLIQLDQYERYFVVQNYDAIRSFEGPVIMDGGSWKEWSLEYLHLADIPIVSEVFCASGPHGFAELCTDLGISRWAMTRGSRGVVWRDGDRDGEIPALPVQAVDTLGAGDIFHGAFCYSFAETGSFVDALAAANRVAAASCESVGTRHWMHV